MKKLVLAIPLLVAAFNLCAIERPRKKAKLSTQDSVDITQDAFLNALKRNEIKKVEALIKKGADVNARIRYGFDRGKVPLVLVATDGLYALCKLLIRNGAVVDAKNEFGMTPLHWAACAGHLEIGKLLIENGADVNAALTFGRDKGKTPLILAGKYGRLKVCQLLAGQVFLRGNIEAAKERLYTLLGCFKKIKLPKDVQKLLLSYDEEILPYLIPLVLKGNNTIPNVIMNKVLAVLDKRITDLKPLMKKAYDITPIDKTRVRILLDPDRLVENFCSEMDESIKKCLGLLETSDQVDQS